MKYNRSNFHKHTFCVFSEVPPESVSGLKPGYTSKSGSAYFFTDDGVFRLSNHWGRAANCKWRLQAGDKKTAGRQRIGFAKWTDFQPDNAAGKLYFIEVDLEKKSCNYQHKSNLTIGNTVLRTASETEKIIKQIRNLMATDGWAKHFDMEIGELRKHIIGELATTEKTLPQIKSELLANNRI